MSEPVYIPDHTQRATVAFISKFRKSTKVHGLAAVFVDEVQELEDVIYSIILERILAFATGAQLDALGKVVGEARGGLDDDTYRLFIEARILTNLSEAEAPRLVQVLKIITSATRVKWMATYPASFIVQCTRLGYTSASYRNRILKQVEELTPSGVGFVVVEAQPNAFGFDDDPEALGFDEGVWAEEL